jgi:hypothetical protein
MGRKGKPPSIRTDFVQQMSLRWKGAGGLGGRLSADYRGQASDLKSLVIVKWALIGPGHPTSVSS